MVTLIDGANWAEAVTAVGTVIIGAGLIFAGLQYRDARRAHFVDNAVSISRMWESKRLIAVRRMVAELDGPEELRESYRAAFRSRTDQLFVLQREPNFFEDLGALWKMKSVSIRCIDETLGGLVIERWGLWEPTITDIRQGLGGASFPRAYENYERLAGKLIKRRSGRQFFIWRVSASRR